VQFDTPDNAETAISKFTGYQYGGRPLGLSFVKYLNVGGNNGDMDNSAIGNGDDEMNMGMAQEHMM